MDERQTLLLTAPPWVWTSAICVVNAWHADKVQERCWHLTWLWACTIVGYIMVSLSTLSSDIYFSDAFVDDVY